MANLGSDTWTVVTAPTRLNRTGALWLGGTLALGAVIYAYDEEILAASLRNREDPVYGAILDVGWAFEPVGFMGRTNPYYIAAFGVGYAFKVRPLQQIPAQILESHIIAGGLRNAAKIFIGRRRPFENRGPRAFEFNGGTSFPSGHTSVVFELATIFSHHARLWPVTALSYGLAATVALQRIDSEAHWPSDVFLPAISGTLIARSVIRLHERRELALGPAISAAGAVPGVKVTYAF